MKASDFTPDPQNSPPRETPVLSCVLVLTIAFVVFIVPVALGPVHIGPFHARHNARVQMAHAIGLAMFSYANDNDQMYPDGSSSTEAFQKLLDGGYITDPAVLYIPMPGKVRPSAGQKLKPENVSWDITAPIDGRSGVDLPLLFTTGYKVNYVPGGAAVPLIKPSPQYGEENPSPNWFQRLLFLKPPISYAPSEGIATFYVNNSAAFVFAHPPVPVTTDGSIPNFVPPDFKPDGKTYHQLTPDGVLR